jgi:putative sigma-54 modulation protein
MQLAVTFRHLEPSDSLKEYAREKISRVEKYLDAAMEANVTLSVEKFRHIADVTIMCEGLKVNGQEQTHDMYSAIDMVADKLERQVKRVLQKSKNKKGGRVNRNRSNLADINAMAARDEAEDGPQLVRTQRIFSKPMDVDEAVMQLDLSKEDLMVFTNSETEMINVLYRRGEGQYELIEPQKE